LDAQQCQPSGEQIGAGRRELHVGSELVLSRPAGLSRFWRPHVRESYDEGEGLGLNTIQSCLFFGETPFDEVALKHRKVGLQQSTIAANVVAVGAQSGKVFINHHQRS
jgi:hypothetical protein